ncbi:MAG TPA: hypothetical protein DDY39_15930 [Nitrospira sp.]|nr:hypothetical protein [Nitrospira sp.]
MALTQCRLARRQKTDRWNDRMETYPPVFLYSATASEIFAIMRPPRKHAAVGSALLPDELTQAEVYPHDLLVLLP